MHGLGLTGQAVGKLYYENAKKILNQEKPNKKQH